MNLFSEEVIIFLQIVLVNIILSGDNAIIIGMVASQFEGSLRKKILLYGTLVAVLMRLVFTGIVTYLFQFKGVKIFGGILLLWIVYKLYEDVIKEKNKEDNNNKFNIKESEKTKLGKAILTVAIADITLSLDNVLGVAGAAKGHYWALATGLILSIFVMAILANIISSYIKKYKWLAWIGLLTILWVAIDLIYSEAKILFFLKF
jgi:YjbE family integral membrane protein